MIKVLPPSLCDVDLWLFPVSLCFSQTDICTIKALIPKPITLRMSKF